MDLFLWQENEPLNKEQAPVAKMSKTETVAAESTPAPSGIIKTSSTHSRNSSYPDAGVEVATSTKSLQVPYSNRCLLNY